MNRWHRLVTAPEMYRHPRQVEWGIKGITPGYLMSMSTVDPATGCWLWTGCTRAGYGTVKVAGKLRLTHRLMWEMLRGPVAAGLDLDHLCTVRRCCNPEHLEPVTHAINVQRAFERRAVEAAA